MLKISDFDSFFAQLNGGFQPFTWQVEVLEYLVQHGRWPELIAAPTGAGKSSVVDIHVFANALHAVGQAPRIPRRLFSVVNRRGLVDNQYQHAADIQNALAQATGSTGVLADVGDALRALRVGPETGSGLHVSVVRGGLSHCNLPLDDPASCAVIAATPDMWGSRLLFRGYGASRLARPREAAIFGMDAVLVLDESQLNQQLLYTARRVAELQSRGAELGIPRLQIVETTATPASSVEDSKIVAIDATRPEADRDEALWQRLDSHKELVRLKSSAWTGRPGQAATVKVVAEQVEKILAQSSREATIGCVVNHVDTAVRVALQLRKAGHRVELLVGRLRPHDLITLQERCPGLLTVQGNPDTDVIVATQTLEVGVDVDFQHLVTELAPAASLAQRWGRVNRLGRYSDSTVVLLEPEDSAKIRDEHPPYRGADLHVALSWLDGLSQSISPLVLNDSPPPATSHERLLFQRLALTDVELLSRTSEALVIEPELELFLRDSLEAERPTAGIVVRDLPRGDTAAVELINALSPDDEEVFPASLALVSAVRDELLAPSKSRSRANEYPRRAFLWRAGETFQIGADVRLQPGDILVIDAAKPITTAGVVVEKPEDLAAPKPVPNPKVIVFLNGPDVDQDLKVWFQLAVELGPEELTQRWRDEFPDDGEVSIVASTSLYESPRTIRDESAWIIVEKPAALLDDVDIRQEWTQSDVVLLAEHQKAVSDRAREMCETIGLDQGFAEDVVKAALHHDDGKSDSRFQLVLGNSSAQELWAKSIKQSSQNIRRRRGQTGLPLRWRHEQYSALIMEAARRSGADISILAVVIAGTSHGHGRSAFPHVGEQLVTPGNSLETLAKELFTEGEWDSRVFQLTEELGAFQLAYLSAIERAADAQVSKEGQ